MAGRGSVLPSVMKHDFSKIARNPIQRSVFDRSHGHKTTFDAGKLIPFFLDEVLPGDTFNLHAQIFARLSTLQFPLMDNVFIDVHYWFAPARLLWTNWERFNGAQDDPGDSVDFVIPRIDSPSETGWALGSLADYFGIPLGVAFTAVTPSVSINALPFRMYNLVYNTWYRDENLQDSEVVDLDNGPDAAADYVVLRRGKRHDYFTSCLPEPQKGDAISIPLGTSAPIIGNIGVRGNGKSLILQDDVNRYLMGVLNGNPTPYIQPAFGTGATPDVGSTFANGNATVTESIGVSTLASQVSMIGDMTLSESTLSADLSDATAATINQLREAFAYQQVLELDNRGGTRYTELIQAHFGVRPADYRLQRPEYLGGSSEKIDVRAIAQTTPNASPTNVNALGNLAGYSEVRTRAGFQKSFDEHGYVMGIVNVRADISYQQNLHRMWSRETRFDFYLPALAHLGEQAVLNKEIYFAPGSGSTVHDDVFGYQERWAEYRYKPSQVTGLFRSLETGSLDSWHLALEFSAQPDLNSAFIQDDPPIDRVIQVPSQPHVLFDSYISYKCARPMPVYSIPGLNRL